MKTIIFDIGNVLLNFKPDKFLSRTYEDKKIIRDLQDIVFGGSEWLMLDEGIMTVTEVKTKLCAIHVEYAKDISRIFDSYIDMFTPVQSTVNVLKKLHSEGHRLLYLSNFHMEAFDRVFEKFEFFGHFEGGVVSSKVRLMKPDEKIFNKLSEVYGLIPEECVLVDDTRVNILKAKELGFRTILFDMNIDLEDNLNNIWEGKLI